MTQIDEKRVRRMKRSKMAQFDCKGLNYSCIKWAETRQELKQAFTLVHDEYLKLGYINKSDPSGMFFGLHNLLPDTVTLLVKSDSKVVASLTQVPDTREYGLPMDSIYRAELNKLRRKGRKIAELCALVTSSKLRWKNLFMQMSRTMYTHAACNGIDDFCIMVNPKHVEFYKLIFLFDQLGPEKLYPSLGVPAVALHADLNQMKQRLKEKYGSLDCNCNLYSYMHTPQGQYNLPWSDDLLPPEKTSWEMMSHFGIEPAAHQNLYATAVGNA